MNKIIQIITGLSLGAATGVSLAIVGLHLAYRFIPVKTATFPQGIGSCPIKNLSEHKFVVKVISSKHSSGNYSVEPNGKALLSCGDTVQILGKQFSAKLELTEPIAVQIGEKSIGIDL